MAMTYNSLVTQIEQELDRTDQSTVNQIPNFIFMAQQNLCQKLINLGLVNYVIDNFIAGQAVYAKPGNWRRHISLAYGSGLNNNNRNIIQLRTYEYIELYTPNRNTIGPPQYYADYDYQHFIVAPTPDQNYPYELAYASLPDLLSLNNQTNWFTNYAPNVLFYRCLLESAPYLKDDERVQVWEKYYTEAVQTLTQTDEFRKVDRSTDRSAD